eukprot:6475607-Amphidinium_carterae.1
MTWAAENPHESAQADWQPNFGSGADPQGIVDSLDDKVGQMYIALQQLTSKETIDLVHNCPPGNGLETWRRLTRRFDPSSGTRLRNFLRAILSPLKATLHNLQHSVEKREELIRQFEKRK